MKSVELRMDSELGEEYMGVEIGVIAGIAAFLLDYIHESGGDADAVQLKHRDMVEEIIEKCSNEDGFMSKMALLSAVSASLSANVLATIDNVRGQLEIEKMLGGDL